MAAMTVVVRWVKLEGFPWKWGRTMMSAPWKQGLCHDSDGKDP
jgi:hypothetical protein